jgi:Effector Associated Constant Component 1
MTDGSQIGPGFEVEIEPASDRYDPHDERWLDQVAQLRSDLLRQVGDVRIEPVPVEGKKGGAEALILALGTAGAFTAAVEFFKAWLGRDRDRSIKIKWTDGDERKEIDIRGEALDQATLRRIAEVAARPVGEG